MKETNINILTIEKKDSYLNSVNHLLKIVKDKLGKNSFQDVQENEYEIKVKEIANKIINKYGDKRQWLKFSSKELIKNLDIYLPLMEEMKKFTELSGKDLSEIIGQKKKKQISQSLEYASNLYDTYRFSSVLAGW